VAVHKSHRAATGALLSDEYIQMLPPVKFNHSPYNGTSAETSTWAKASTCTLGNDPEAREMIVKRTAKLLRMRTPTYPLWLTHGASNKYTVKSD